MKLTKIQIEKATELLNRNGVAKLSSFYNKHSTRFAQCLGSYPFKIITDKTTIVEAGFNKLVKAIVVLDMEAKMVQRKNFVDNKNKEIKEEFLRIKIDNQWLEEKKHILINYTGMAKSEEFVKSFTALIERSEAGILKHFFQVMRMC